ncbi:MAG: MobA/MobL family protein [Alphaproteobacteria bacterium]|nr:MobA/MobL family protein [Alphaproteobacteria bacterium]
MAAAAYRAGAQIKDERTGRIHRYEKRHGVKSAFILAPNSAPEKFQNRAVLWNAAESSENRKNSRVAREVILALPHELSDKARAELSRDMGLYLIERYRVAVDVAIHSPVTGDGHDPRNHHAHLLFTTREITEDGFGVKTRILDDKVSGPQEIEVIREVWETLANDALERAGFEDVKIDRRTLADQGEDRIPQTHIGPKAKASEDETDKGEDEQQGDKDQGGKKGSSGGASTKPKTQKSAGKDDEDGKDEEDSKSGSGDAVALKLESKLRKDHKNREVDYRVIDRRQTRQNFVDEIKRLNERRAAFGDKPIKEQLVDLDKLMERLDARLERLQAIETKTSLPGKLLELIEQTALKAAELLGLRKQEGLMEKLSRTEEKAREERQHSRYGRTYRKGLHTQIKEMKTNIERLEVKQAEVKRYSTFVEKLEKEIAHHTPSIETQPKAEVKKPIKKTSNTELSLKLKLKASALQETIPDTFKPSKPIEAPPQQPHVETTDKPQPRLTEKAQVFEPENAAAKTDRFIAERSFKTRADISTYEKSKKTEQDWKTRNAVPFKAMVREMETRTPPEPTKQEARVRTGKTLQQELRREHTSRVEKAREHVPEKHKPPEREVTPPQRGKVYFKDLEDVRSRKREDVKGSSLRSKFKASEKPTSEKPPTMTNEEHSALRRSRSEEKRSKINPKYKAEPYAENNEPKANASNPKPSTKTSFSESSSAAPKAESSRPKMSCSFNEQSDLDETQNHHKPDDDEPEADI